jgi:hypothetical protein
MRRLKRLWKSVRGEMKTKRAINLLFKFLTLLLLCAGFTLAIMEEQWIWALSLSAASVHALQRLLPS